MWLLGLLAVMIGAWWCSPVVLGLAIWQIAAWRQPTNLTDATSCDTMQP